MANITIEVSTIQKELFTATAKKQNMTQKEFLNALLKSYKGLATTAEISKQKADEINRKAKENATKITLTKAKLENAKKARLENAKKERELKAKLDKLAPQATKPLKAKKA